MPVIPLGKKMPGMADVSFFRKGSRVLARCGACGNIWYTVITNPKTRTGGVLVKDNKCPKCKGGYKAGIGMSVRSR